MNILQLEKYQSPQFKIGDKVQLKSGGPEMEVIAIALTPGPTNNKGDVFCAWFDVDRLLHIISFHPVMLQYYK